MNKYTKCTADQICAAKGLTSWKVDTSFKYYIDNWYLEMDLKCMQAATIGLMVTAFFLGFAINGLFFTIPDKYGRKWTIFFAMVLSCIAQTVMLFVPNFKVRTAMFFLMGLT